MPTTLPTSVQQIADVIGRDDALSLIRKLPRAYSRWHPGGQPILYVPKLLAPDHTLVKLIGFQAAEKLARVFGGEILYPAALINLDRATRDQEVAQKRDEGVPEIEVARLYGITVRQVRNIRRKSRQRIEAERCAQYPQGSYSGAAA